MVSFWFFTRKCSLSGYVRVFSTKSDREAFLRIGRSIRNIPEDYRHFFSRPGPSVIDETPYAPDLKFILHLNEGLIGLKSFSTSSLFVVEGKKEVSLFLWRLRWMMKWGHFFWRLSDLSAIKFEVVRVIKPLNSLNDDENEDLEYKSQRRIANIEMRIHWELKVLINKMEQDVVYIDGKETLMSMRSLFNVQMARIKSLTSNNHHTSDVKNTANLMLPDQKILFTGINRYVFDGFTGYCRELHVERVEPKIDKNEWKWRTANWFNGNKKIEVCENEDPEPAAL